MDTNEHLAELKVKAGRPLWQGVLAGAVGLAVIWILFRFGDPDTKVAVNRLASLTCIAGAVGVAVIWMLSRFGDRNTKVAVNRLASLTGFGANVIPWPYRAQTEARKLVELNANLLAKAIQGITHQAGRDPVLAGTTIIKLDERINVELTVRWKIGGLVEGAYQTTVSWEISKADHISAKVTADNAAVGVTREEANALNEYFRAKVYPAFYRAISG